MSSTAVPPVTAAAAAAVVTLSLLSITARSAFNLFALIPGNTVLGERHFWNIVTGCLIETNVVKLGLQLALLLFVGSKAEQSQNPMLTRRLALAALVSCAAAGTLVTLFYLMAYMYLPGFEGDTKVLYPDVPIFGMGPLTAAFAVAAHQLLGSTPLVAGQEILTFSIFPLSTVLIAAVSQEVFSASRDLATTLVAVLVAWAYLRFVHVYGPGSVGDTRDAFEFLSMLPGPLGVPLRPLVKLLSAVFMRLPPFSGATGDGFKLLPLQAEAPAYGGSGGVYGLGGLDVGGGLGGVDVGRGAGGTSAVNDPVAERRRERALRALDRKLAELRSSGGMATGVARSGGIIGTPALVPVPPTPLNAPATPLVAV